MGAIPSAHDSGSRNETEPAQGDGTEKDVPITCRIDALDELDDFKNGGILQALLRDLAA